MKRLVWRYNSENLSSELTGMYSFKWKESGTMYPASWNVIRLEKMMGRIIPSENNDLSTDGLYGNLYLYERKMQAAPILRRDFLGQIVLVCSVEWGHLLPDRDKEFHNVYGSVRFPKCEVLSVCKHTTEAMEFVRANSHFGILHDSNCIFHGVTGTEVPVMLSDCTCNDKEKTSGYNAKDIRGISGEAQTPLLHSLKEKYPVLENEL